MILNLKFRRVLELWTKMCKTSPPSICCVHSQWRGATQWRHSGTLLLCTPGAVRWDRAVISILCNSMVHPLLHLVWPKRCIASHCDVWQRLHRRWSPNASQIAMRYRLNYALECHDSGLCCRDLTYYAGLPWPVIFWSSELQLSTELHKLSTGWCPCYCAWWLKWI